MASIKKGSYHGTLIVYLTFSAPLTCDCSSYWNIIWPAKLSRVYRFVWNSVLKRQFLRPKPQFELSLQSQSLFQRTFIRWHSFLRALTKNLSLFMSETTSSQFSSQSYSDLNEDSVLFMSSLPDTSQKVSWSYKD